MTNPNPSPELPKCRYCGGAGKFQVVSSVSDHAWATCFCSHHVLFRDVAQAQEDAENGRENCVNCEGEGMWEHCPSCSLTFGRAIDLRRAALSPQTLPAPGEVERLRQALRNIAEGNLGDQPWQANYVRIKEVAADAIATQPATAEPFGYWVEQRLAEPVLLRKPSYIPEPSELRTVTPLYASPTLATVAAANDEGVAEAGAALVKAWNSDGDGFSNTLPPIEFSEAELSHLVRAVLLSQGGGK